MSTATDHTPRGVAAAVFKITRGPSVKEIWNAGRDQTLVTFHGYLDFSGMETGETSFSGLIETVGNRQHGAGCKVTMTGKNGCTPVSFSYQDPAPTSSDPAELDTVFLEGPEFLGLICLTEPSV